MADTFPATLLVNMGLLTLGMLTSMLGLCDLWIVTFLGS